MRKKISRSTHTDHEHQDAGCLSVENDFINNSRWHETKQIKAAGKRVRNRDGTQADILNKYMRLK